MVGRTPGWTPSDTVFPYTTLFRSPRGAGLRARSTLHPFPEELSRVAVMRASCLLFAPNEESVANLEAMGVKGRIVQVPGNTSVDALRASLGELPEPGSGPVIVTMHRVDRKSTRLNSSH